MSSRERYPEGEKKKKKKRYEMSNEIRNCARKEANAFRYDRKTQGREIAGEKLARW